MLQVEFCFTYYGLDYCQDHQSWDTRDLFGCTRQISCILILSLFFIKQDILSIRNSMKEIHQLFFDLSLLLEEQGTQLDMIEVNVFLTVIKKDMVGGSNQGPCSTSRSWTGTDRHEDEKEEVDCLFSVHLLRKLRCILLSIIVLCVVVVVILLFFIFNQ